MNEIKLLLILKLDCVMKLFPHSKAGQAIMKHTKLSTYELYKTKHVCYFEKKKKKKLSFSPH